LWKVKEGAERGGRSEEASLQGMVAVFLRGGHIQMKLSLSFLLFPQEHARAAAVAHRALTDLSTSE
jgi:hypothetical protein